MPQSPPPRTRPRGTTAPALPLLVLAALALLVVPATAATADTATVLGARVGDEGLRVLVAGGDGPVDLVVDGAPVEARVADATDLAVGVLVERPDELGVAAAQGAIAELVLGLPDDVAVSVGAPGTAPSAATTDRAAVLDHLRGLADGDASAPDVTGALAAALADTGQTTRVLVTMGPAPLEGPTGDDLPTGFDGAVAIAAGGTADGSTIAAGPDGLVQAVDEVVARLGTLRLVTSTTSGTAVSLAGGDPVVVRGGTSAVEAAPAPAPTTVAPAPETPATAVPTVDAGTTRWRWGAGALLLVTITLLAHAWVYEPGATHVDRRLRAPGVPAPRRA